MMRSDLNLDEARAALRFCNSFTRLPTLIDLTLSTGAHDWLSLLGEEWSGCDNITEHLDDLIDVTPFGWLADSPSDWRGFMMTDQESEAFHALPDEVAIYRGCYASNEAGASWSLSRAVAERFPSLHRYRQEGQPLLINGQANKTEILALKLDREEAEVIVLQPKIFATSAIRISLGNPAR